MSVFSHSLASQKFKTWLGPENAANKCLHEKKSGTDVGLYDRGYGTAAVLRGDSLLMQCIVSELEKKSQSNLGFILLMICDLLIACFNYH